MEVVAVSDSASSATPAPEVPDLTEFRRALDAARARDRYYCYPEEVEPTIEYVLQLLAAARDSNDGYAVIVDVDRPGVYVLESSLSLGNLAQPNPERDLLERALLAEGETSLLILTVDGEVRFFVIRGSGNSGDEAASAE